MQQLKVREGKGIHSQGGNVCNKLTVLYKMPLRIAEGRELIPQRVLSSVFAENFLDAAMFV